MKIEFIPAPNGAFQVPGLNAVDGESKVILMAHGFGSEKRGTTPLFMTKGLKAAGFGVYGFDFPAHGDSALEGDRLTVENCVASCAAAEARVRELAPDAEIGYFGSSFGAYTTLNYLAAFPHAGKKAFLRSSAVVMHHLVETWVDDKAKAEMAEKGYFVPDYDYVREMRVTPLFLEELAAHNVFETYRKGEAELFMVHGGQDSVAPVEAAREFAKLFGAEFLEIPQGEHNLMGPGELEQVLAAAGEFFKNL